MSNDQSYILSDEWYALTKGDPEKAKALDAIQAEINKHVADIQEAQKKLTDAETFEHRITGVISDDLFWAPVKHIQLVCEPPKYNFVAVLGDPPKPAEAPCRGCGRPNDVGVKTCWCCGGADPTAGQ